MTDQSNEHAPRNDQVLIGDRLMHALIEAGVVTRYVTRVIIDVQWRTGVTVHVETLADERLLDIIPTGITGAEIIRERPRTDLVIINGDDDAPAQ